jgi:TonB-linked SusC/RagA family outer membrane protein
LLSGLTAFMVAPAVAQQQGAVVGTVTDAETLRPVAGAQIYIPGTVIGTITNPEGIFRLEGVPAGTITVELRLIGYKDASQTVTVLEGQVVTADFQIQQTALRLQDIVVTGVVAETPRVKLPFTVERIDNEDMPVATSDVSTLLAGKGAGISVASGSGRPGDAADILLRGPTSIDATGRSQAPLIVVDGVIQGEHATLADINALDIDHVEIVKGAAAASLYGSRAQNGVVQITTKRGQSLAVNTFNVTLRGEFGVNQLAGRIGVTSHHSYVMNEDGTKFIDTLGNEVDFGDLGRDGGAILAPPPWDPDGVGTPGTSFQDDEFPGPLYDQLDTFFDPGDTYSLYGAATGRFGESSFRVSFESFRETGVVECSTCELVDGQQVVKDDGYRRYNARLNVDSRLGDQFDIAASGFYSNSDQDNAAEYSGAFFSLPWMSPAVDLTDTAEDDPDYPYNGLPRIDPDPMSNSFNPLYGLAIYDDRRERSRVMGSLDVAWTPITWFSVEGNASYDRTDSEEWIIHPKDELVIYTGRQYQESGGRLYQTSFYSQALNGSLTAGFNYGFLDGDLATRLKVRYVYEDQEFATFDATGLVFTVPEVPSFGNISGAKDATNEIQDIRAEGYFGIASLDYKGRYIVDGLVRRDGSSLFGAKERWQTYWRMSAAWRVAQEAFWGLDWWDELKLRFSVGTAGGRPNFWAQYETYAVSQGNVTPTNLGNTALKPEFTRENEAGVNLVFLQNIGLDVTYAWAETKDQLLQVPMPGFVGFSSQWQNAGTIKSNPALRRDRQTRSGAYLPTHLGQDHERDHCAGRSCLRGAGFLLYRGGREHGLDLGIQVGHDLHGCGRSGRIPRHRRHRLLQHVRQPVPGQRRRLHGLGRRR